LTAKAPSGEAEALLVTEGIIVAGVELGGPAATVVRILVFLEEMLEL
jgi:hypothetical protein